MPTLPQPDMAAVIAKHRSFSNIKPAGQGWETRCETCGDLPGGPPPNQHVAEMLAAAGFGAVPTMPPMPAPVAEPDADTFLLATLIAQVLSGGSIDGTNGLPAEVILTATLIKGQGWRRCEGCGA